MKTKLNRYKKPKFKHDCEGCYFLGTLKEKNKLSKVKEYYDIYFCHKAADPDGVFLFRYSDLGCDNISMSFTDCKENFDNYNSNPKYFSALYKYAVAYYNYQRTITRK